MSFRRFFFRSPEATEIGTGVAVDAAPAAPAPAPEGVSQETPQATPAPRRIEDVLKAMAEQAAPAAEPAPAPEVIPPEELAVTLPPRRDGEEPLAFQAQTREQAEALRRLNNGYLRGEQAREVQAQAQAQLAELQAFEQRLTADPVGVLLERVPQQVRANLVEALIATDFETVKPVIDKLYGNPEAQALARASITDKRTEYGQQVAQARTQAEYNAAIEHSVGSLIPDHASQEDAVLFARLAHSQLVAIDSAAPGTVTPESVSEHLGSIAARFFGAPAAEPSGRTTEAPAPAPQPPAVPAPVAPVSPQTLTARAAARAIAPQGAGAAPATILAAAPKGQTIQERAAWAMKNLRDQGAR